MQNKTIIAIVVVIVILLAGWYYMSQDNQQATYQPTPTNDAAGTQQTSNDLVSTWQSNQDEKFKREFMADGKVTDRYEGQASATASGTWTTVNTDTETIANIPAASIAGKMVIKISYNDGTTTYFAVNSLTQETLSTTDLSGNGAVTTYTRVSQ